MGTIETVVRELEQLLDASRTAPEWRWNAHRRLVTAGATMREQVVPAQARGCHDDVTLRLADLGEGALDRLHADELVREVDDLVRRLRAVPQQR